MKKFFPILLSLLLLSVCLCACNGTHRDKAVIASAQQYADGGNFTQAESMLIRAISENPSAALYTALSKIFVAQDKLRDASLLLDSIPDSELYAQMQQLRPAAPTASHPSGIYNKNLQVSFLGEGGTLLVCQDDICPSLSDTAPEGSLFLTTGDHTFFAVTVSDTGLVSPVSVFHYTISGVVEEVNFADPALEALVRRQLGISESGVVLSSMLWEITELTLPDTVATCADLSWFPNLTRLSISGVPIPDSNLWLRVSALEKLEITNTEVSNQQLRAIALLPDLQELSLKNCNISNISPLENALGLKSLNLTDNLLSDLSPLSGLSLLERLSVDGNPGITSLQPLLACANLRQVSARRTAVDSVDAAFAEKGVTVTLGD